MLREKQLEAQCLISVSDNSLTGSTSSAAAQGCIRPVKHIFISLPFPLSEQGVEPSVLPYMLACSHSLGPHQVLVFECRSLKVDDPLGPQRDLEDTANLDVDLSRTQDHHIVILQDRETRGRPSTSFCNH